MHKIGIISIICIIVMIVLGSFYLLFRGTSWFISSFDGDAKNTNYIKIVKDYYLFNTEKDICINTNGAMSRITSSVDSLNWNEEIIVGYSNSKYFKINIQTMDMLNYETKDSLLKNIHLLPSKTIDKIPSLKK